MSDNTLDYDNLPQNTFEENLPKYIDLASWVNWYP